MKTGLTILAGLLAGVLVAAGVLAALVFVGPDSIGLRPTTAPTLIPSVAPSPSPSAVASPSLAVGSGGPSAGSSGSPVVSGPPASADPSAAFHIGQAAPTLFVDIREDEGLVASFSQPEPGSRNVARRPRTSRRR
jgi:hypothetical protein